MLLLLALGFLLIMVNAAVTVGVVRSTAYEPAQKVFQFLLIWLVPIIGVGISWYVLREEARSGTSRGDGGNEYLHWNYPDRNEDHSGHDHGSAGHDGGGHGGD